jgi:hypothetical protein
MRLFMRHYVGVTEAAPAAAVHAVQDQDTAADEQLRKLEEIAAVLCDEVSLDVEPVVAPEPALVGAGQDDRAVVAEASAWSYLRNPKTEPAATEAPGTVVRRSLWRSMLPGLRRK